TLCRVEFRSVFHASSRKFKILVILVLLAQGKSYDHGFTKKYDGHKLYSKSRVESSFDRFFMHENSKHWQFTMYWHGFMKKRDDHKLCAESSFDRFFVHRLGNSKNWPFTTY
ncbi:hypothetical protein B296_00056619, partial [Ensete ventricosum]